MTDRLLPALAVLASLALQNVGAAFAKSLFPVVGSPGVAALRVGFAALLLLALWRPWRLALSRTATLWLIAYGAALGLMNLIIYLSFQRIPIGIAVAIEVTGPLAVVLLGSRRPLDFAWAALAIAGLVLLTPLTSDALDPLGVAFALIAALCWALYIVFGKRVSALVPAGPAVAIGMSVAALIILPVGIADAGATLFAPGILAAGILIALVASAIPYSVEMAALRRLPQRAFGIAIASGPALAALAGYLLLGEALTWLQITAIACVIAASVGGAASH
jgi:inner membrane transporter RhtA